MSWFGAEPNIAREVFRDFDLDARFRCEVCGYTTRAQAT